MPAPRSSFEGQRFGKDAGSGPNASRDAAHPTAKQKPPLGQVAERALGRRARQFPKGKPSWEKG